MSPTRPPNSRTISTPHIEVLESPILSASSLSTPSVTDDQDPINATMSTDGNSDGSMELEESRGRSPTVDASHYDNMDPRNMSPRRNSDELDQMGAEAKARLEE